MHAIKEAKPKATSGKTDYKSYFSLLKLSFVQYQKSTSCTVFICSTEKVCNQSSPIPSKSPTVDPSNSPSDALGAYIQYFAKLVTKLNSVSVLDFGQSKRYNQSISHVFIKNVF